MSVGKCWGPLHLSSYNQVGVVRGDVIKDLSPFHLFLSSLCFLPSPTPAYRVPPKNCTQLLLFGQIFQ